MNPDIVIDDLARRVALLAVESAQRLARIVELEQQLAEHQHDGPDEDDTV